MSEETDQQRTERLRAPIGTTGIENFKRALRRSRQLLRPPPREKPEGEQ